MVLAKGKRKSSLTVSLFNSLIDLTYSCILNEAIEFKIKNKKTEISKYEISDFTRMASKRKEKKSSLTVSLFNSLNLKTLSISLFLADAV